MILRVFVFATIVAFTAILAFATPQIPDILIYQGKEYPIQQELLGEYFKKHPERKIETDWHCSALWRGYVASFEVVDDELVLKGMTTGNCDTPRPVELKSIVLSGGPLKIDWLTGLLLSSY